MTFAAVSTDAATAVFESLRVAGARGRVYAVGRSERLSAIDAAVYNGTAAHALDFDDTLLVARSHVSAHLLPALISSAAISDCNGHDALTAYAIGAEVEARFGELLQMRSAAPQAWHPTGMLGTLGATATAARVLRLDRGTCLAALGIAASMASGARLNIGTMTKPLHAGLAARNGVQAALMARAGVTANIEAWGDEDWGLLTWLGRRDRVPAPDVSDLGKVWTLDQAFGLALKPNPSCARTHAAIEATRDIAAELHRTGATAAHVEVHVTRGTEAMLRYARPETPLEAKFSMHYCVAAALNGPVGISVFSDEHLNDPGLRSAIELVEMVADRPPEDDDGAIVRVRTSSGEVIERQVRRAPGWPERWPSDSEIETKFLDCCDAGGFGARADEIYGCVTDLPQTGSMTDLTLELARLH